MTTMPWIIRREQAIILMHPQIKYKILLIDVFLIIKSSINLVKDLPIEIIRDYFDFIN